MISSSETHDELLEQVDEHDLPELYGGLCCCKATCIYSEKGPWSEVENFVNYQDPTANDSDEFDNDDLNEMQINASLFGGIGAKPGKNNKEEFKMMEDDGDHIDLLEEKRKSKDLREFYAD